MPSSLSRLPPIHVSLLAMDCDVSSGAENLETEEMQKPLYCEIVGFDTCIKGLLYNGVLRS